MIAVIIPCYGEKDITNCVSAVFSNAKRPKFVEVVVSYAGRKPTVAKALLQKHSILFVSSKKGRAVQMNSGADAAKGEKLLFLHADTTLPKNWDGCVIQVMKNGASCGAFLKKFDSKRLSMKLIQATTNLSARIFGLVYGDNGIWCSRSTFYALGGFAEVPILEDQLFVEKARKSRTERFEILSDYVLTSARRFETYGVFRTIYKMRKVQVCYLLGQDLESVAKSYRASYKQLTQR